MNQPPPKKTDAIYTRTEDRWGKRTYHLVDENLDLTSVTTYLSGGVPKPALNQWFKKVTAECAVENIPVIQAMLDAGDKKAAIDYLVGASYRTSNKAADVGSEVHAMAEAMANGWPLPEIEPEKRALVVPFLEGLKLFFEDWDPQFPYTEVTVFNPTRGYAGSFDAIMDAGGARWLIDWKTTKPGKEGHGIYPEYGLQLAAYRYAEFMVTRDGTRAPMVEVDGCLGINIRPGSYAVIPVRTDQKVFHQFLYAMQVAEFVKHGSDIVGDPLAPPVKAVPA